MRAPTIDNAGTDKHTQIDESLKRMNTCISQAIEECVLAEWPAGQLKVRPPRGVLHRAFSPARVRFPSATAKSRAH